MIEVEAVKTRQEIAAVEALLRKHHGEIYADIWKVHHEFCKLLYPLFGVVHTGRIIGTIDNNCTGFFRKIFSNFIYRGKKNIIDI